MPDKPLLLVHQWCRERSYIWGMRIGMILDAPFPTDYRVEKEARTLANAGHQVVLFCLNTGREKEEEEYKGFRIARYPTNVLEYKLSALAYTVPFYHWMMAQKLRGFITTHQPDVLHVHDMVIARAAFDVARMEMIPVVLDLHENRPEIMKEYRHVNRFPGKVLINLRKWQREQDRLIGEAHKVVVVTASAKADIVKSVKKPSSDIIVLPNTPSKEFLEIPIDQALSDRMKGTFNLLYVGDTSERRGTADLIKAVAELKGSIPEIRLWMVGKSSFDQELNALATKLGVEGVVHFEGWQPERLFPSYIHGAAICLSPLKRNQHHDTTYANKLFQYMAYSRPLILSDCTAQAELVRTEDCGLVFTAGDVNDLAAAVMKLYREADVREKLGKNAKDALVNRWLWESTSRELLELYRTF